MIGGHLKEPCSGRLLTSISPVPSTAEASPDLQAKRHSAYRSQFVVVQYRWHPLHGERLGLRQRTGRRGQEILYLEVRSGISREIPAWMCDAAVCTAMLLGPAQVGIDALNELAAVLSAYSRDSHHRGSSSSVQTGEAHDETPITKSARS